MSWNWNQHVYKIIQSKKTKGKHVLPVNDHEIQMDPDKLFLLLFYVFAFFCVLAV